MEIIASHWETPPAPTVNWLHKFIPHRPSPLLPPLPPPLSNPAVFRRRLWLPATSSHYRRSPSLRLPPISKCSSCRQQLSSSWSVPSSAPLAVRQFPSSPLRRPPHHRQCTTMTPTDLSDSSRLWPPPATSSRHTTESRWWRYPRRQCSLTGQSSWCRWWTVEPWSPVVAMKCRRPTSNASKTPTRPNASGEDFFFLSRLPTTRQDDGCSNAERQIF